MIFFHLFVSFYKEITCEMNYIIDSIPVPICQNRINRSKIAKGKQYKKLHNKYAKLFYIIDFQLVKNKKRHTNCISFYRRKNGRCESLRVRLQRFFHQRQNFMG